MDEFAFGPKEIELLETKNSSDTSLQDVLNLLNNGKLEVDYIIESVDEELTSGQKWGWLALGIVLTPLFIGFFLLWALFASGTLKNINSTTHTIGGRYYLRFCHSILEYKYKNEQLVEAKLTKLNDKSYVSHGWKDFGDNGGQNLAFYINCSGNYRVELGECNGVIGRKEIFQEVYQKVKDFCRISGLKNYSKVRNKKYAEWIKEMS